MVIILTRFFLGLPDHPAVKPVLDLLRNIIVDSFAVAPATKGDTVIDTILEVSDSRFVLLVSLFFLLNETFFS